MYNDPLSKFHFIVDWGGKRSDFLSVSGLEIRHELVDYREGGKPSASPRKIPGLTKYSNVVLRRGITKGDNDFFEWMNTKRNQAIEKRNLTINLLNDEHEPVLSWRLTNAFPVRLLSPTLDSLSSDIAVEELELAYESMQIESF